MSPRDAVSGGAVRDHDDERPVTKLEYEAYRATVVREMERLGAAIEAAHHRARA